MRFHDLRHTMATLLLESDVHPKKVQERLGHSSIAITMGLILLRKQDLFPHKRLRLGTEYRGLLE